MAPMCRRILNNDGVAFSRSSGTLADDQLVVLAKDGDRDALAELVKRYGDKVFRTTLRITRNREDAEDAAQDCFISALVHLESFDGRSQFSTWLTRIAINAALMRLRKNRTLREVSLNEPQDEGKILVPAELVDSSANPEQYYREKERLAILSKAIEQLRPALRVMVETHHRHGGSLPDAARVLGISTTAAKGRLFHARVVLRRSNRIIETVLR